MSQTKTEIQSLLESIGTHPRHRFGQNFMIDQNLVRLVADAGLITKDDLVIEVGPGTGTLTEELLSRGARVIAVEIDRNLAQLLRDRFAGNERFELIEGDALDGKHAINAELRSKWDLTPFGPRTERGQVPICPKLVANLPYNIASPLVIELLIAGCALLAFTVQKEVAERLRADESSDAYGPLSVMAAMLSKVELLRTLPPQAFWPAPKIESALVRMTRHDQLGADAPAFGRFVQSIFSFRRKTLRKALALVGLDSIDLPSLGIDPGARPENLSPKQFLDLFQLSKARPAE